MRFLDTNVVIYSILSPRKGLEQEVLEKKKRSIAIFNRINNGEKVIITTSHLTEITNILETRQGLELANNFLRDFITKENIKVIPIDYDKYLIALAIAEEKNIHTVDALAYLAMKEENIEEIYTFDKHFINFPIKIIQK